MGVCSLQEGNSTSPHKLAWAYWYSKLCSLDHSYMLNSATPCTYLNVVRFENPSQGAYPVRSYCLSVFECTFHSLCSKCHSLHGWGLGTCKTTIWNCFSGQACTQTCTQTCTFHFQHDSLAAGSPLYALIVLCEYLVSFPCSLGMRLSIMVSLFEPKITGIC